MPLCLVATGLMLVAARGEERIRPNTFVGLVAVGGLTRDDAARKLRVWWETEKRRTLTLHHDALTRTPPPMKPSELGLTLDDQASVDPLPYESFWADAGRTLSRTDQEPMRFDPVFRTLDVEHDVLRDFVRDNAGRPQAAAVRFRTGAIVREPEISGFRLDESLLPKAIVEALKGNGSIELPLIEAAKRVPDEALDGIVDLVSEFTTKFPASQYDRSSNIQLAASHLDGVVLMPGDSVSFNNTVGRRTIDGGFKEAGVYVNGRHDVGVGGGICQVSTTLYNAALFANLKILKRQNHSMPVAYVPVGRDATVDYGSIDLVIENNYDTPIAVSSEYERGRLTFRILGQKDTSLSVKLTSDNAKSWALPEKIVKDPTVPLGKRVIVEKGSKGHSINTYRVVYRNGVEIAREPLGRSYYRGGQRIIAVNPNADKQEVPEAPEKPEHEGIPDTVPPIGDSR